MAKVLRHWVAWQLWADFRRKFRAAHAPEGTDPAELAAAMRKSLRTGELAAPLTLPQGWIRINPAPGRGRRTPSTSAKLRAYLDSL